MFVAFLQELLTRRKLSLRQFAALVGVHPSTFDHLKAGRAKPPLHRIEHWAQVLQLDPKDRAQFLELARLEHCPPEIAREFLRLKRDLQDRTR